MERTLLEEFVIILLHPYRGLLMTMGNTLSQAVAVATLTDLLLSGLIVLDEGKVKRYFLIRKKERDELKNK